MGDDYVEVTELTDIYNGRSSATPPPQRSNALSNKVTGVLSTSFADADISEALRILDGRNVQNSPAARRNLRLNTQEDVIHYNGNIVKDFGYVAEVGTERSSYRKLR